MMLSSSGAVDRVCRYRDWKPRRSSSPLDSWSAGRTGCGPGLDQPGGSRLDQPTGSGSRLLSTFDPLPEWDLDVRDVVDRERIHVRERTARDVLDSPRDRGRPPVRTELGLSAP